MNKCVSISCNKCSMEISHDKRRTTLAFDKGCVSCDRFDHCANKLIHDDIDNQWNELIDECVDRLAKTIFDNKVFK